MIFGIKENLTIFTQAMFFLAIAANIPVQLKTGFVVQVYTHWPLY